MPIKPVKAPLIRDHEDQYQRDARQAIKSLDTPGLKRSTVTVTLGVSVNNVAHQLGKIPVAWQVVDRNANAVIWRTGTANSDTIPLQASATVTVTLQFW